MLKEILSVTVMKSLFVVSQSEEAAGGEPGPRDEENSPGGRGGGEGSEDGGRGEEEEEVAMETPNAPVYCICRRPDINCFMM